MEGPSSSAAVELQNRTLSPLQEPKLHLAETPRTALEIPTPLPSITNAAALVDCPVCGERAMTRTEALRGTTTRDVFSQIIAPDSHRPNSTR